MEMLSLKKSLYDVVTERYHASVQQLQNGINELQTSANEETKSSVGDKYETGRAMIQLEIEKLGAQMTDLNKVKAVLAAARPDQLHTRIQLGSLVETSSGYFYLTYNAGEISIGTSKAFCISLQSPLGKQLLGKASRESVTVNGKAITIINVA
jgi:transcription elongation GreA/GreB family factor